MFEPNFNKLKINSALEAVYRVKNDYEWNVVIQSSKD